MSFPNNSQRTTQTEKNSVVRSRMEQYFRGKILRVRFDARDESISLKLSRAISFEPTPYFLTARIGFSSGETFDSTNGAEIILHTSG